MRNLIDIMERAQRGNQNSMGNLIAHTEESLLAFRSWFGNSQVIDEQGRPLVLFHGTHEEIHRFDGSGRGAGSRESPLGHWFTENPQTASQFADFALPRMNGTTNAGRNVIPVYLKLERPLVISQYTELMDLVDRHTALQRPGYNAGDRSEWVVRKPITQPPSVN